MKKRYKINEVKWNKKKLNETVKDRFKQKRTIEGISKKMVKDRLKIDFNKKSISSKQKKKFFYEKLNEKF